MKKTDISPLPTNVVVVLLGAISVVIFLLVFFLTPPPAEFQYVRTETAEVVAILKSNNPKGFTGNAIAQVKLQNGATGAVPYKTRKVILVGQNIQIDVLEADGKKPRYRLAQDPIAP